MKLDVLFILVFIPAITSIVVFARAGSKTAATFIKN